MGIMYFDAQPIPEVVEFIREHYKGGSVIDFGCGTGRYADCFPDDMYLGIDGHEKNIEVAKRLHPNKQFAVANIDQPNKGRKYDYLFSSVVLDQLKNLPKGWAKTYILIEPEKYEKQFKPKVSEVLRSAPTIRMMVCE